MLDALAVPDALLPCVVVSLSALPELLFAARVSLLVLSVCPLFVTGGLTFPDGAKYLYAKTPSKIINRAIAIFPAGFSTILSDLRKIMLDVE